MPGVDPGPVDVGEEAGHSGAGAELPCIDQFDSLMNWFAVRANDKRMSTFSDQIIFLVNTCCTQRRIGVIRSINI